MTTIPPYAGIHHLQIPVSDLDRSIDWYGKVLGARRRGNVDHKPSDAPLFAVGLEVPGLGVGFELRLNPTAAAGLAGCGPLAIAVEDPADLDAWVEHLDALGVEHSPVLIGIIGWVLVVPDPDGIKLRIYTNAHHNLERSQIQYHSPWLENGPFGRSGTTAAVGRISAVPGSADELESLLISLGTVARKEPGNLAYHVHRTADDPNEFVIYEEWSDPAALDNREEAPGFAAFMEKAGPLIAGEPQVTPLIRED
ncbi:antibiotic biosynthesis monooxygenase [Kribbella sp. NPDC058245]|uniref:antibiotic biosynthesis monooxygenase n=1 Tax=Kribbella sp. NPDC058245 TaxID=3346399 RepID=UPI0036E8C54D